MTTYAIPSPTGDPADSERWQRLARVKRLCFQYLGREPSVADNGTTVSVTFTPDLSAADLNTLIAIVHISGIGVVTPAEYVAVSGDVANLKAYLGLTSPTNAQSVAAIKSLIRVLGVIVRD